MDSVPPAGWYEERPGRWVALSRNGRRRDRIKTQASVELLSPTPPSSAAIDASPQDCGLAGGEYFRDLLGPELPGDQRPDDDMSVCFDGAARWSALDIVGAPVVRLKLSADRPRPSRGPALRRASRRRLGAISYGVLNLTHRNSHEFPEALVPGETVDDRGQCSINAPIASGRPPAAHCRSRSTYWPMIWPSPEPVRLTLVRQPADLPVRAAGNRRRNHVRRAGRRHALGDRDDPRRQFRAPCRSRRCRPEWSRFAIVDDFGAVRDLAHGLADWQHRPRDLDDPS